MSRRRELLTRIGGLTEISEILGAMKGLALVELRRIGERIDAQRESVDAIETALAGFLHFHREGLTVPQPPYLEAICVVGAERGFCGDFNTRIVAAAQERIRSGPPPDRILLVGDKLAESWPESVSREKIQRIGAPSVADEIAAALTSLLDSLQALMDVDGTRPLRLTVLHLGADGISCRQLLPIPDPPPLENPPAYPPMLNLSPHDCFSGLADAYLYAMLNALAYDSLYEENRRRLQHMEQALHRIDEQLEVLQRRQHQLRQEEIIEEIEVILLTASDAQSA